MLGLIPFATTYMYEMGFSFYISTKTKYRNILDVKPYIIIQLSSIKPDIKNIYKNKKQFHLSYSNLYLV